MCRRVRIGWFVIVTAVASSGVSADLKSYLARPEPAYGWTLQQDRTVGRVHVYHLRMTSQTWQGIRWNHNILVYLPDKPRYPDVAVLLITGGSPRERHLKTYAGFAASLQAPFVHLYNIPNQPLMGGLSEDNLIAHTFEQFLKTGDETWPLLLPMTKSVVKAMDAVQAFAKEHRHTTVSGFVLTGASKRGWTTWLTATIDERVRAIAPMVYDNLDLAAQMDHQLACWGRYSGEIDEYTDRGLQARLKTEAGQRLAELVDPYAHREKLTMPKLILNGTNDPYWPADALRIYWDELPAEKWALYIPNAGHGVLGDGRAGDAIIALHHHAAGGPKLPRLEFAHGQGNAKATLRVRGVPAPDKVRLWSARSPVRDFRKARWTSQEVPLVNGTASGSVELPADGFVGVFGEAVFKKGRTRPLSLCTTLRICGR